jgi:hypothetical protein
MKTEKNDLTDLIATSLSALIDSIDGNTMAINAMTKSLSEAIGRLEETVLKSTVQLQDDIARVNQ